MKKLILGFLIIAIFILSGCVQTKNLDLEDDNLEISSVGWWELKCAAVDHTSQPIPIFYLHNPDGKYGEVICKIQVNGKKYDGSIYLADAPGVYPTEEHKPEYDPIIRIEKSGLYKIKSLEALSDERFEYTIGVCCYNQLSQERKEICKTKKLAPAKC